MGARAVEGRDESGASELEREAKVEGRAASAPAAVASAAVAAAFARAGAWMAMSALAFGREAESRSNSARICWLMIAPDRWYPPAGPLSSSESEAPRLVAMGASSSASASDSAKAEWPRRAV